VAEVVTGEAVVLDVPYARFPSRLLALLIDLLIQAVLLVALFVMVFAGVTGSNLDPGAGAAIGVTVAVLIIVGYPVIWETASRGATPGKFALGLRVIGDDGSPERFRQALARGVFGLVEIWVLYGFLALVVSLLSPEGKRVGDYVAGTKVIQRRLPRPALTAGMLAGVPPALAGWAASLELSSLRDGTAETARQYLMRYPQLTPQARAELGTRLAAAVAAQVSPPPPAATPPADYLAAVLGERSRRAHARLAASDAAPDGGLPPAAWAPPPAGSVPAPAPPPPGSHAPVPAAPGPDSTPQSPARHPPAAPGVPASPGGFSPPV